MTSSAKADFLLPMQGQLLRDVRGIPLVDTGVPIIDIAGACDDLCTQSHPICQLKVAGQANLSGWADGYKFTTLWVGSCNGR